LKITFILPENLFPKNLKSYLGAMINPAFYSLSNEIEKSVSETLRDWKNQEKIERLWRKDASLWTGTDESNWLGWLEVCEKELQDLEKYRDFAEEASTFDSIVLLGMGGSSLCPEVLAVTFERKNFRVLDSTVPAQIKAIENGLDLKRTLFIVASKSGTTLEPNCFEQYFYEKVSSIIEDAGQNFVAITDPNSKLQALAESKNYRRIFLGEPQIGGRFSALSVFGMVPASAMKIDVEEFLKKALPMVRACRSINPEENPGAVLGIVLGVCQNFGKDKLTIFSSPEIYNFGAWLEQLIAESTGKEGVAIIPVDREPLLQEVEDYSGDRVFVYLKLKDSKDESIEDIFNRLTTAGHPTIKIELESKMYLGQEFFRWEFATAVAGSIMKINPFNQPDVESAKIEARKLMSEYAKNGNLPYQEPVFQCDGIKLFTSADYARSLEKKFCEEKSLKGYLEEHITHVQQGDYFAILAYLEMNDENEHLLQAIRQKILQRKPCATCLGFGPRFLHSTGQAYKGGGNNGVFLQITCEDEEDIPVPHQGYTFGIVKMAQARGDFQVLLDRKRRALWLHLSKKDDLKKICSALENFGQSDFMSVG
jgi:transaldolase/glucose-6-phosphate isomerase